MKVLVSGHLTNFHEEKTMLDKAKKLVIPVVAVIAVIYAIKSFAPSLALKLKL